jgi:hypothetical protein
MPFTDVADFAIELRRLSTVSARCLELTILTAARTNEAIKAIPSEFDLDSGTWTIPAARMKAERQQRTPFFTSRRNYAGNAKR